MRTSGASAAVALLTLLAFALRAWGFDQGLLGDELFAYAEIHGQSLGGVLREVRDSVEVSPPLFFLLASLAAKLGDPTVWIRLPSLLLGTALVPLTFVLGRMTAGRAAGLCAAALVTVSPFAIFYADEARPYATLTFFAALSACCLLFALRADGRRWWIAYAVSTALVIYSHYTGVFVLIAQTLWALWFHRERIRAIAIATAGALALFLPWLSLVDSKGQLAVYGRFEPDLDTLAVVARVLAGHPFIPLRDTPGLLALATAALACLAALCLVIARRRRSETGDGSRCPHALLLAALVLSTPAGVLVASTVTGYDLFNARNLSASLPAASILVGWLLTAPARPVGAVLATLAVLAVAVGGAMTLDQARQRPDARAAAAFVRTHADPSDDLVYVAPAASISNRPLDPYLPGWRRPVFGDSKGYADAFARAAAEQRRVVVAFPSIASIRALVAPPKSLAERFRLAEQRRFPGFGGGLAVRIFEPTAATARNVPATERLAQATRPTRSRHGSRFTRGRQHWREPRRIRLLAAQPRRDKEWRPASMPLSDSRLHKGMAQHSSHPQRDACRPGEPVASPRRQRCGARLTRRRMDSRPRRLDHAGRTVCSLTDS